MQLVGLVCIGGWPCSHTLDARSGRRIRSEIQGPVSPSMFVCGFFDLKGTTLVLEI